MGHSREPVKHTCPDIDKVIKISKTAMSDISDRNLRNFDDIEDLKSHLYYVESCLSDIDDLMEQLRSANESLRQWGTEEAEQVDKLEEQIFFGKSP